MNPHRNRRTILGLLSAITLTLAPLTAAAGAGAAGAPTGGAQPAAGSSSGAPGMGAMPGMPGMDGDMAAHATPNGAMDHEHMEMGPHMKMSATRPRTTEDERRAAAIVETVRAAIEKYRDYHAALADHFEEFAPNVPQPMYHFTNYQYGIEAHRSFDAAHPTSLLYKPKPGGGFELIGAMFTAPVQFDADQLDQRVPLSIAAWHQHINVCLPPRSGYRNADWNKFGFHGTIATAAECDANQGIFHPVIFGWMVHVYPFEKDPAKIWAH